MRLRLRVRVRLRLRVRLVPTSLASAITKHGKHETDCALPAPLAAVKLLLVFLSLVVEVAVVAVLVTARHSIALVSRDD